MSKNNINDLQLPDYMAQHMNILSVGLNPSLPSVQFGYYFANPRNRFWKAFIQAKIIDGDIKLDANVHKLLLEKYLIGFTDVVKRASRMGHELRTADFKQDAPCLRDKIEFYQPKIVWFHGKIAFTKFMLYGYGIKDSWQWGLQDFDCINAKVYVTPNPSPANAAYSLNDLISWYQVIAKL